MGILDGGKRTYKCVILSILHCKNIKTQDDKKLYLETSQAPIIIMELTHLSPEMKKKKNLREIKKIMILNFKLLDIFLRLTVDFTDIYIYKFKFGQDTVKTTVKMHKSGCSGI